MKLPWDKQYLKISFHVIITIIAIYILGRFLWNIGIAVDRVKEVISAFIGVLGPLIVALVFSYLASPMVDFFQSKADKFLPSGRNRNMGVNTNYKKRGKGTLITYIVLFIVLGVAINAVISKIGSADATELAKSINDSIEGFSDMIVLLYVKLEDIGILENVDGVLKQTISSVTSFFTGSIQNLANYISMAGGWAVNLGIGMTISFYLLVEKEKILYFCNDIIDVFFKEKWARNIKSVCHDFNSVFSGYIGGQITDALIMATLITITFSLLGIRYAFIIGVISGFSNLIPFVGAIVAFILSVTVGLLSGAPIKALYAAIAVLVLQQVDSIFIVPKVVGKSVELHPVLVLLSLSVFGSLFGLLGMVVAVPVTALIKIFLTRFYNKKKEARNLRINPQ